MPGGQTFTDSGTLSFATGDEVTITTYGYNNQISVSGNIKANGTTFNSGGGGIPSRSTLAATSPPATAPSPWLV